MQQDVEGSQEQGSRPAGADGSKRVNWSSQRVRCVSTTGQGTYVKYYVPHLRIRQEGWSDSGWCARLVFDQSVFSQPTSFLPLLQLTPWPASVLLLKYSYTNGF